MSDETNYIKKKTIIKLKELIWNDCCLLQRNGDREISQLFWFVELISLLVEILLKMHVANRACVVRVELHVFSINMHTRIR